MLHAARLFRFCCVAVLDYCYGTVQYFPLQCSRNIYNNIATAKNLRIAWFPNGAPVPMQQEPHPPATTRYCRATYVLVLSESRTAARSGVLWNCLPTQPSAFCTLLHPHAPAHPPPAKKSTSVLCGCPFSHGARLLAVVGMSTLAWTEIALLHSMLSRPICFNPMQCSAGQCNAVQCSAALQNPIQSDPIQFLWMTALQHPVQ